MWMGRNHPFILYNREAWNNRTRLKTHPPSKLHIFQNVNLNLHLKFSFYLNQSFLLRVNPITWDKYQWHSDPLSILRGQIWKGTAERAAGSQSHGPSKWLLCVDGSLELQLKGPMMRYCSWRPQTDPSSSCFSGVGSLWRTVMVLLPICP